MIDPDNDLRDAFRRCRSEDALSAPVFPGLPLPRQAPVPGRSRVPFRFVLALSGAAALAAIWVLIRPASPAVPVITLAEAMPQPWLLPSTGPVLRLTAPVEEPDASASDFLLPHRSNFLTLMFP